jgi:hypothetical protein
MNAERRTWPNWLPRVLWIRRMCPRCSSTQFKPAQLHSADGLFVMLLFAPFVVCFAGAGTTGFPCESRNDRPRNMILALHRMIFYTASWRNIQFRFCTTKSSRKVRGRE